MLNTLITISRDPINNKLNAASGILSLRHLVKSKAQFISRLLS